MSTPTALSAGQAVPNGKRRFPNDVFISCSLRDREWVREYLLPRLEQEKLRIFDGLLLALLGLMLVTVGTVLLCGFVVLLFAEGYRLAALAVMTLAFGLLAADASRHDPERVHAQSAARMNVLRRIAAPRHRRDRATRDARGPAGRPRVAA